MRKLFLSGFFLIALHSLVFGQQLYREGYILTSPFDTLRGQIKYQSYNQAAIQCTFRDGTSGVETTYLPKDLYGYGIDDNLLFKAKQIDQNQPVFLEVIYEGTLELYGYRDRFRRDYFFLENPTTGDFEALTQKVIGNNRRNRVYRTYIDVLKIMLAESDLVLDEIDKTILSHRSLTNLLVTYDERYASFKGKVFNGSKIKWPLSLGVYTIQGLSQQKLLDYAGTGNSYYSGLGLTIQKEISRGTRRLYLEVNPTVGFESFGQDYTRSEEITDRSIITNSLNFLFVSADTDVRGIVDHSTTVDLKRINLTLPVNIKYIFPGKKWLVSLNGGLNPQYTVSKSGQIRGLLTQNSDVLVDITSREETERFRVGINLGFGLILKGKRDFFIDFQHSPTWFNQGVLKYKYSFIRIGAILTKKAQ